MQFLIYFLFLNVFAATLGSADLQNDFAVKMSDPKKIQISVIDSAQADSLFSKLASNQKFAFKYPVDGCYARATQMSEVAEYDGIITGRVYAGAFCRLKPKVQNTLFYSGRPMSHPLSTSNKLVVLIN